MEVDGIIGFIKSFMEKDWFIITFLLLSLFLFFIYIKEDLILTFSSKKRIIKKIKKKAKMIKGGSRSGKIKNNINNIKTVKRKCFLLNIELVIWRIFNSIVLGFFITMIIFYLK